MAVGLLLLLALPLANLILLLPWPRQHLANSVGGHLGVPMTVDRASLWPWSGLRLHGVRFGHDHDHAAYLWCRHLQVSPRWRSLPTATWQIDRIELSDFELVGRQSLDRREALPGDPGDVAGTELPEWPAFPDPLAPQPPQTGGNSDRSQSPQATEAGDRDPAVTPPDAVPAAPRERLRWLLGGGRRELEVGELVLSGGALRVVTPGGVEQQLLRVGNVALSLDFGGDRGHGEGRMTVGLVEWPGGLTTTNLQAEVALLPGPTLELTGHRPGVEGLKWRLQSAVGQPGTPFVLEIGARELQLTELFDQLPGWVEPRPTWINGQAVAFGLAAHPSTVQAAMNWRMENLGVRTGDHLRRRLGGSPDGRLDRLDLHSLGLHLRLGGRALLVDDLFVKSADGIGRSRFAITPDGRLQGAIRLYATPELRDMTLNVLGGVPWARLEPTLWQVMQVELGGPWREPLMRFSGRPADEWWSPFELLRALLAEPGALPTPDPGAMPTPDQHDQ